MIKELTIDSELEQSVDVIRNSFQSVADRFNLTRENCPTHPSFVTHDRMLELKKKGSRFFGLFDGDTQVGFVAIEKSTEDLYFLEKLAVAPAYRHRLFGMQLVRFALDHIKKSGGTVVSIGIIDEHTELKQWYEKLGFREVNRKKFDHLPFTVCFMEMKL
ncbi:MAG: GNAT family N-acetyltransferase [Spirochaetes bacterium]|nr:GNAT family N-acetyltransferase [Spirochaetota bacterium]